MSATYDRPVKSTVASGRTVVSGVRGRVALLREVGAARLIATLRRRAWSDSRSFGLACSTEAIPPARKAAIPVDMEPVTPTSFGQFGTELERVSGDDYQEVFDRVRMCENDVRTLYVATDADGEAIYAQWLVEPAEQAPLHRTTPLIFPQLQTGDMLVEGAYTFSRFRRLGAMGDGMHQLLQFAGAKGARRVLTYVSEGNVSSLRGCANAGFAPDHLRITRRRLGARRILWRPLDEEARGTWARATEPRPSQSGR